MDKETKEYGAEIWVPFVFIYISILLLAISISGNKKNIAKLDSRVSALEADANKPITMQEFQRRLKDTGNPLYDPGPLDGIPGPNTLEAARNWECTEIALQTAFKDWRR